MLTRRQPIQTATAALAGAAFPSGAERLPGATGVPCRDARKAIRFAVAGDGKLLDNLGTTTGSRRLELAHGRSSISLRLTGARAVAGLSAAGIATGFRTI
jgi:beta-galactosidase